MSYNYSKDYYEVNAILTLKSYWKDYVEGFKKGESPDWQNKNCNIGVEVVRLITENEGRLQNFNNKHLGKSKKDIKDGEMKKFKGDLYYKDDKIKAISPNKGLFGTVNVELIKKRYNDKLELLNRKYEKFNINCIYLFYNPLIEKWDIDNIFKIIENEQEQFLNKGKYIFDYIFIDCSTFISIIDYKNKKFENIDTQDRKILKDSSKVKELLETEFK